MSCPLYSYRQDTLVPGTSASPAARFYLSSIRYVATQFFRVFIINYRCLIGTKSADLTVRYVSCPTPSCRLWFSKFLSRHY